MLIPLCDQVLSTHFNFHRFHNRQELLQTTISDMAGGSGNEPLKVISLAYKEMELREYQMLMNRFHNDVEAPGFRENIEYELNYIGTFGLRDPVRDNVMACVELIKFGRELKHLVVNDSEEDVQICQEVNVRMLSGDHIETCRQIAYKAGIIS